MSANSWVVGTQEGSGTSRRRAGSSRKRQEGQGRVGTLKRGGGSQGGDGLDGQERDGTLKKAGLVMKGAGSKGGGWMVKRWTGAGGGLDGQERDGTLKKAGMAKKGARLDGQQVDQKVKKGVGQLRAGGRSSDREKRRWDVKKWVGQSRDFGTAKKGVGRSSRDGAVTN